MIFTRLKLNNFKSHEHTVIPFEKGISVIVGENGAGKSTILEAISFALYKQHTAKKIDDLVLKIDVINAIYNMLKAKSKNTNEVYGVKTFSMSVNNDGELNASGLLKVNMEGPFIMKRGQTLFQVLPFSPETANYFINGTASSFSNIQREVVNEGFVILYYNKATSTVYAYKQGTSVDTTVNVKVGYVTHIYYNTSDNLTPNSVEIDLARYYLGNSDVKFAFAYAGTLHIGDKIVFIYEKASDDDATYVGTLTSAFLFDTLYD